MIFSVIVFSIIYVLFPLSRATQETLRLVCDNHMYQVHCYHTLYDAADSVITSVTFIQSQLLDVFRHPKTIPGAEERKKEQHGQPSHDGRYADHAVQISLATNLGLFKIITIDFTNISHNWFSGASGKWFSGHQI